MPNLWKLRTNVAELLKLLDSCCGDDELVEKWKQIVDQYRDDVADDSHEMISFLLTELNWGHEQAWENFRTYKKVLNDNLNWKD